MKTLYTFLIIGCLAMSAIGQDVAPDKSAGIGAATPQEAMENLQAALAADDREAVLACFALTEAQVVAFGAQLDLVDANNALGAKAAEAFGADSVEQLNLFNPFQEILDTDFADCTFTEDGDSAVCIMPSGEEIPLLQSDGVWLFDMEDMPTDQAELAREVVGIQAMTAAFEELGDEIDAEGMTLETFKQLFEERMTAVIVAQIAADSAAADAADRAAVSNLDLPVADTPQQVVQNLSAALEAMDRQAFLTCFDIDDTQTKILGATFDMMVATMNYQAEVEEVFGEDAAAGGMFGGGDSFAELRDAAADVDNLEIETHDDGTASWITENGEGPTDLVQVDGVWKFSLGDEMPSDATDPAQTEPMISMMESMAEIMEGMVDEVGKEGMTVEQLEALMQERMMIVMMQMMQQQPMEQPVSPTVAPADEPMPELDIPTE